MSNQFEVVGDMADWPKNVPGKATQAAVFGVYHPKKGKCFEVLWTGQFPDLEPALYWAAKKEMQAVRKDKWIMASRLVWQHELTPEQALAVARKQMEPQVDQALRAYRSGGDVEIGPGPMRVVEPDEAVPRYVELVKQGEDDPIASFVVPPEAQSGPDNGPPESMWAPPDPRKPRPRPPGGY
jgi:hypothetical protein